MATTTTVPTIKTQLVSQLQARTNLSGVTIAYSWPGTVMPAGTGPIEVIFLGKVDVDASIPSLKAGRKQRQEDYTLDVVFWVIQPFDRPDRAQDSEARCLVLFNELEDLLAEDPLIGLTASTLQWMKIVGWDIEHAPVQKGWATQIVAKLEVHARLV
jgi:hypothetical protein